MGIQINGSTDRITAIDGTIDFVSNIGNIGLITASNYVLQDAITIGAGSTVIKTVNGTLGIGIASPTRALTIAKQDNELSGTGNNFGIYIYPKSNGYCYLDALTGSSNNTSWAMRTYNNGVYNTVIQSISGNETTFSTANTERLRITSAGNIGIGTDNPAYFISIENATPYIRVKDTAAPTDEKTWDFNAGTDGILRFRNTNDAANSSNNWLEVERDGVATSSIRLLTGSGTERLRITSDGKLGIGVNSPSTAMHLKASDAYFTMQASSSSGNAGILFKDSGGTQNSVILYDFDDDYLKITTNNDTERLRIESNGKIAIGNHTGASHDIHVKHASSPGIRLEDTTNSVKLTMFAQDANSGIANFSNHDLLFYTNSLERVRITSGGDVCINQSGVIDNAKLSITCDATQPAIGIQANHTNTDTKLISAWNSGGKNIVNITAESDNSPYLKFEIVSGSTPVERFRVTHLGNVAIGGGTAASNRLEIIGDHKGFVADSAQPNATFLIKHGTSGTDRRWIGIGASTTGAWIQSSSPGGSGLAAPLWINKGGGEITLGNEKLRIESSGDVAINTTDGDFAQTNGASEFAKGDPKLGVLGSIGIANFSSTTTDFSQLAFYRRTAAEPQGNGSHRITSTSNLGRIAWFGASNDTSFPDEVQRIECIPNGSDWWAGSGRRASMRFTSNAVGEYMRLNSGGQVHIGSSGELGNSHSGWFQVIHTGGGNQTNDCLTFFETNANDWIMMFNSNEGGSAAHYHLYFMEEGSARGSIWGSHGSNVNYNQGSDYRWKENIVDLTGSEGIDICKKLKPRKYNWIKNREGTGKINTVDGFIAHEVAEAGVLGAVTGEKDAVKEDGSIDGQMLDYGQMTPVLAAAIKGLIAKVETLEAEVASLKSS